MSHRSHAHRVAARRRSAGRRTARSRILGGALVGTGMAWLADILGFVELPAGAILSVFLLMLGIGLVLAARWGPYWNLVMIGLVIATILTATSSVGLEVSGGIGDSHLTPLTAEDLSPFTLGIGDLQVDLTKISFPESTTDITGTINVGHLSFVVPRNIPLRVESHAGLGRVVIFGMERNNSGFPIEDVFETSDFDSAARKVVLKLSIGIGEIEVIRGS